MTERFRLVSDEIRAISRVAEENPDRRALRQWVVRHGMGGLNGHDLIVVDEVELLEVASAMLQDDRDPLYEERGKLEMAFQAAIQHKSAYLLYALRTHRARLMEFMSSLEGGEAALVKRLRNLERGIEKRIDSHGRLEDELNEIDGMSALDLFQKYATQIQKMEVARDGFRRQLSARFNDEMEARYQRMLDRLNRLSDEIHTMDEHYAHLSYQLELLRKLQPILDGFNARLECLVSESELPVVAKSKKSQAEGIDDDSGPKKRKGKTKKPVVSQLDDAPENDSSFCSFKVSIDRLRRVIANARGEITVVLPNNIPAKTDRLLRGWEELLRALGFQGEVVAIDYRDIGKNDAPIIVPRGMNTHKSKWADPQVSVVVIGPSQTLLLNYLRRE